MDNNRFDTVARILATAPTRRRSLGLLAGVGLGGLSTLLGFPWDQEGKTRKQQRKRKRTQKRKQRKDKRKGKREQPRTGECASGTKPCNETCIDNSLCCMDDDCENGQVCDANHACVTSGCPDGTRLCGSECIDTTECCSNADCSGGQTCEQGSCTCPSGTKLCNESCISDSSCCSNADCSGGQTCQEGICACPSGSKLCEERCISNDRCCTDEECPDDKICQQGSCACPSGSKLCQEICIAVTQCCTDADCANGKTCQEGKCVRSGAPLYPELRTRPATDLSFDRLDDGTHILRFSNTVWNAGEGRLEIEGNPNPSRNTVKKIYQNLYDAPVGGSLVSHKQVNSDIIYHPGHMHFHFANFASYLLLQRDAAGVYKETTKKGTKTSFCIMDTDRYQGSHRAQYTECGTSLQGLTSGWGDTYGHTLPDQWVVLGNQPLADGEYGIQSTADPKGVLNEGGGAREKNNTNVTYFTVSGGQITNVRNSP